MIFFFHKSPLVLNCQGKIPFILFLQLFESLGGAWQTISNKLQSLKKGIQPHITIFKNIYLNLFNLLFLSHLILK